MSKPCSLWPRENPFRENVLPAKRTNGVRIPADPNIKIALWLDSGARPCNSSLFLLPNLYKSARRPHSRISYDFQGFPKISKYFILAGK